MKLAACLPAAAVAAALLSGCAGIDASAPVGGSQTFGYPAATVRAAARTETVEAAALPPPSPAGQAPVPAAAAPASVPVPAATPSASAAPSLATEDRLPVYDHEKDPYVTAVLRQGSAELSAAETLVRGPDGKMTLPPEPPLAIIDVRDASAALKAGEE